MFAITGITGRVGGAIARQLLQEGKKVRAVVRSLEKGAVWSELGCEVVVAAISETAGLKRAFTDAEAVFLMTPPDYDPQPNFPDTHKAALAIQEALVTARPGKLVFLSTVGAQVAEPNLLNNATIVEQMLRTVPLPVALLRAAWFMENASWDLEPARRGLISSFLQPLAHQIPMVSTSDIAANACSLLANEQWQGVRIVELEGPRRYSALDIAASFSAVLHQPVDTVAVPRASWESLFRSQGMQHPGGRMRMLDGFNEGWIDFEGGDAEHRRGSTTLEEALRRIVQGAE
jgi:NAD(P)H dehydrogenase (quinone)